jgi:5-methylcytosine-specific restriction endonuclease McrA
MTASERKALEPFLREVATGPVRSTAVQAAALLKRLGGGRKPVRPMVRQRREVEGRVRESRKLQRQAVRAECVKRAGGKCENCCARFVGGPLEMDHFHGRAVSETVETCWLLCRECHRQKTENNPNRQAWDDWFRKHCEKHGYPFRARLTKTLRGAA